MIDIDAINNREKEKTHLAYWHNKICVYMGQTKGFQFLSLYLSIDKAISHIGKRVIQKYSYYSLLTKIPNEVYFEQR